MKRLAHALEERVSFLWNGKRVEGREGDTVASALYALGIRELARSRKNHRPLGLSGGHLQGVLARVGGRPNVRLDLEPVVADLDVRMQNVWPSARLDLLSLARLIPARWLRSGFEHTQLMPSGTWRFQVWERLLAFLAGMADPPGRDLPASPIPGQRLAVDLLVVGGGPSGREAANAAAQAGKSVALACRGSRPGRLAGALGVALPELDPRVRLFAGLEIFGLYRGGSLAAGAPSDPRQGAHDLRTWPHSARHRQALDPAPRPRQPSSGRVGSLGRPLARPRPRRGAGPRRRRRRHGRGARGRRNDSPSSAWRSSIWDRSRH